MRWLWLAALWAGPAAAAAAPPPPPDAEVTFVLPAGRRECFYQSAPGNISLEAEYQVPAGAGLVPGGGVWDEPVPEGRGRYRSGRGLGRASTGGDGRYRRAAGPQLNRYRGGGACTGGGGALGEQVPGGPGRYRGAGPRIHR